MSIHDVKKFYEQLSQDEVFRDKIQNVSSKEDCSRIVKAAGYDFTQQEFEDYTAQLLDKNTSDNEDLVEIGERELEAVHGGFLNWREPILIYGGPPRELLPWEDFNDLR
jgi:predicted ribosomally synthesized peptide with nif11-like leader